MKAAGGGCKLGVGGLLLLAGAATYDHLAFPLATPSEYIHAYMYVYVCV